MASLLSGRKLIRKDGSAAAPGALQGKIVVLYFSASWCGPCRQTTPVLKDFYDELNDEHAANIEVVYVPGDKSAGEMMAYFREMHGDWLALDMADYSTLQYINWLNQKYQVQGIPSIIVIQPDGETIDANGRNSVMSGGPERAWRNWLGMWKGSTTVSIHGLVGGAQYNGQHAVVTSFDVSKGRYQLQLCSAPTGSSKVLSIKPANVTLVGLSRGAEVVVKGLKGAAQHNGKRGVIISGDKKGGYRTDTADGNLRYGVQLPDGTAIAIKLANIDLAEMVAAGAAAPPEPA